VIDVKKDELIGILCDQHRQLMRYLFYFEKDSAGQFVPSERPKFGTEEMMKPGVVGDRSLRDLLCHLLDWERRFLRWYEAGLEGESPQDLLSPHLDWEAIDTEDLSHPGRHHNRSVEAVLRELEPSFSNVLSTIKSIPEQALFTPGYYAWTGEACVADYVALCTYRLYEWAKGLIRRWRKRHAGAYLNKQVVLDRIRTERRWLEQNLESVSEERMELPGVIGEWTAKDLLAHLLDWEQRLIGWYEAGVRGEVPQIPAPGLSWGDLDLLNRRIYEKHRDRNLEDVRRESNVSYARVLALVEGISEDEMFAVGRYEWLGGSNLVGFILANTANHYRWAKEQIRGWLKSLGEL
jgi:hypothetical protein